LDDFHRSLRTLQRAVISLTAAEMGLAEDGPVKAVSDAEEDVALAARDFVSAVSMMPSQRQPKGWNDRVA
jgi:hypothetical protein